LLQILPSSTHTHGTTQLYETQAIAPAETGNETLKLDVERRCPYLAVLREFFVAADDFFHLDEVLAVDVHDEQDRLAVACGGRVAVVRCSEEGVILETKGE
jgi:hypothetical protein